jgi:NTP pyrophosphatase (non-canonical NTP hydrolase)
MHIEEIERVNLIRKARWHSEMDNWVLSDWSNAMAGEAGEACNVVKKIRRIETGLRPEVDGSMEELRHKLAMEIADVFLYLQLLASEAGINMTRAIVEKFNFTSRKYDFPERLSYEGREL